MSVVIGSKARARPSVSTLILLVLSSVAISGGLYAISAVNLAPYLGQVTRPTSQFPWWTILVLRAIEITGYTMTGYTDPKDVILLSILARTPYLILLHTTFTIPIYVLLMSLCYDTIANWLPIAMLQLPHTKTVTHTVLQKDLSLTVILTLITSSFMGIAIYVAQKTVYPAFVIGHFDAVKSIMPLPLPLVVAGLVPASYCLQEIIYDHGFAKGTVAVLAASFVVGGGKIALGVQGSDVVGVFGIIQSWNATVTVIAAALGVILRE